MVHGQLAFGDILMARYAWTLIVALPLIADIAWAGSQELLAVRQLSEAAIGCPFCSAQSLTMAEEIAKSDAVLLVKWTGGKAAAGNDPGTTEFEVVEAVRSNDKFKPGEKLSLVRYRAAKTGTLFALLGTKAGAAIDWGSPLEVSADSFAYMKNAPAPDVAVPKRLKFFVNYLEAADPMIAADAYGEFANAPYADIAAIAQQMPREKLRKWVADENTSPSRLGLYGLMLGLCGTKDDIPILESRVFASSAEFRIGLDGVMGGYLLLTREAGLAKLEQAMIVNKKSQFSDTYAAMQAVRFLWQYGDGKVTADRLRQSMRLLLDRPELADMVIPDLARWQDWSVQSRLMELYGKDEYDIPSIKRAIVRYMLASTKDAPKSTATTSTQSGSATTTTEGESAEHVRLGNKYLAELEAKDPKTVSDAKRFYFMK